MYKTILEMFQKYSINLPCTDYEAYSMFPDFNFVYNRLWLSTIQGLSSNPVGIYPKKYPVIIKPIINLFGMSKDFFVIKNKNEYMKCEKYPHFTQPYLSGNQYNIDLIIVKGKIIFYNTLISKPHPYIPGAFLSHKPIKCKIPRIILIFIRKYLYNYTGCFNAEIINDFIIECHLRLNGDNFWYTESFFKKLKLHLKSGKKFRCKLKNSIMYPIFKNENKKVPYYYDRLYGIKFSNRLCAYSLTCPLFSTKEFQV